jgi:hypothetical protein
LDDSADLGVGASDELALLAASRRSTGVAVGKYDPNREVVVGGR